MTATPGPLYISPTTLAGKLFVYSRAHQTDGADTLIAEFGSPFNGPGDAKRVEADARLFVGAEALREALAELADLFALDGENSVERFERLAAMFRRDTGYMAPGKDQPASGIVAEADRDKLIAIYEAWYWAKVVRARAALAMVDGGAK